MTLRGRLGHYSEAIGLCGPQEGGRAFIRERITGMKRYLALTTVAALGLAAVCVSLPLRAAGNPPQTGTITTVAGTGQRGFSGDNGPATQARLDLPAGIVTDAAGNVFIGDADNLRVRK